MPHPRRRRGACWWLARRAEMNGQKRREIPRCARDDRLKKDRRPFKPAAGRFSGQARVAVTAKNEEHSQEWLCHTRGQHLATGKVSVIGTRWVSVAATRCRVERRDVSHLRRSIPIWRGSRRLRTGLTYAAPPALVRVCERRIRGAARLNADCGCLHFGTGAEVLLRAY